jgi:hypothetical protein
MLIQMDREKAPNPGSHKGGGETEPHENGTDVTSLET